MNTEVHLCYKEKIQVKILMHKIYIIKDNYNNDLKGINIGGVKIGGTNRIAIQSMTNTFTEDVDKTVAQILRLEEI